MTRFNGVPVFGLPAELKAAQPDVAAALDKMFAVYLVAAEGEIPAEEAATLVAEIGADAQQTLEEFTAAVATFFAARIDGLMMQTAEQPTAERIH